MGVFGAVIVISCASFLIGIVIGYNLGFKECTELFKKAEKNMWNSAIDDFANKLLETAPKNYAGTLELGGASCYLCANQVKKIAEQLKR